MKTIFGFLIFLLVLFLYLHIQFHLKTSDDLEMYEIDSVSKDKFEEICNLRQPVLFDFENYKILQTSSLDYLASNYNAFEIKIRNSRDHDYNSELYMPLPLHASIKLFNDDKTSSYFSENNMDFLQETGVIKNLQYNDEYLRPYMVSNCNYDVIFGSKDTETPFRYEINYRTYFLVTQGSVEIKMAPPKSIRYLHPEKDYENFEFRSLVNPWNPQPQYSSDFDTIIPQVAMYGLQNQNVKRNVAKKVSLDELKKNTLPDIIYEDNRINNNESKCNTDDGNEIVAVNEITETNAIIV